MKVIYFLGIFGFVTAFGKTDGLFCYSCNQSSSSNNVLCNQNEPEYCLNELESCITTTNNRKESLTKGCGKCPRSDQMEFSCKECSKSLCNGAAGGENKSEKDPLKSSLFFHGGQKYKLFHGGQFTFWEGRMICAQENGSLANIQTKNENDLVKRKIADKWPGENVDDYTLWVGGIRNPGKSYNGYWIWLQDGAIIASNDEHDMCTVTGENEYTNWVKGHPKVTSSWLCMLLDSQGRWLSTTCGGATQGFLCEIPSMSFQQTVYYDGLAYTYYSKPLYYNEARDDCVTHDQTLATLSDKQTKLGVLKQLVYSLHDQAVWTKTYCVAKLDDLPGNITLKCEADTKLPYICQGFGDPRINEICEMPTDLREKPPEDSILPQHDEQKPNTIPPCDAITVKSETGSFFFLETEYNSLAYSVEKCGNGLPRASLFCPGEIFDENTLSKFNCEYRLSDSLQQFQNTTQNLTRSQILHALAELSIVTSSSNITTEDLSSSLDMLGSLVGAIETDQSEVTIADLARVVEVVRNLKQHIKENPNERKISDRANRIFLVDALESIASKVVVDEDDKLYVITNNDITIGVQIINGSSLEKDNIKFILPQKDATSSSYISISRDNLVDVHAEASHSSGGSIRAVFMALNDNHLFPTSKNDTPSQIVSVVVTDGMHSYSVPVKYALSSKEVVEVIEDERCFSQKCKYYDEIVQVWSDYGCKYDTNLNNSRATSNGMVHCECNHTTSFSVVLSQYAEPSLALDIATTIGLIICIIFLTLTVILFAFFKELRKIRSAFIHANLCACLVVCYFIFLIGIQRTDLDELCVTVAALIHFFIIASWGWMITESITMYRMFAHSFDRPGVMKSGNLAFGVYVTSALIVALTFALSVLAKYFGWKDKFAQETCHLENEGKIWSLYAGGRYCWLHGSALYFGFLTVVGLALIFNAVFCVVIVRAITWGRKTIKTSNEESPIIHVTRAALVALLLGISWIFAIPLVVSRDKLIQEIFGWLFAISLVFQGIFIFYFFCLRRKDVRDSWMNSLRTSVNNSFISRIKSKSKKDSGQSSFPATYFDNNSHQSSIVTPENWRRLTSSASKHDTSTNQSNSSKVKVHEITNRDDVTEKTTPTTRQKRNSTDLVEFEGDKVFES